MARRDFRMQVGLNKLPELGSRTHALLQAVVSTAATDIRENAQAAAPVDTGNLKNSIQDRKTGDLQAEIAVGAEYGAYVEFGTENAPAQPYLTPAVLRVEPVFRAAVGQAVEKAARE